MADLLEPINFQDEAERLQEDFLASEARNIQRAQVLPPREPTDIVTDATNILFGDFGKALGVTLDKRGLRWNVNTAKDAWVDHPVRSAIEVGLNLGPVAFKAMKFVRGKKLLGVSDEAIRAMNLVDDDIDLLTMPSETKDILKGQVYNLQRKRDLQDRIASGMASKGDETFNFLEKKFGNRYMEAADPISAPEYMNTWVKTFKSEVADNETFRSLMKNAPPDEEGIRIAQFALDPSKLTNIPEKYRPWALQIVDELKTIQSQGLKEGFTTAEEVKNVGPAWFSMLREGTPNADIGDYTRVLTTNAAGKTEMISIPKTSSPNLLQRKMKKGEVADFLVRQEAVQALDKGSPKIAKDLLDDRYKDVKDLIDQGEHFKAVKALTVDGTVDLSPKSLTVGSMAKQKALLESYRSVRDLSIQFGKKAEELTPDMRGQWKSLDELFGSDRIRRMVGVAKGLDGPVDELGSVPLNAFRQIEDVLGKPNQAGSMFDILDMATSMHKVMKTAGNIPAHGNNILGNSLFMWNAGVNIMSPEYWKIQGQTWNAVRKMQRAHREKGNITNLGDLGSIKTLTGKTLSLADELNSKQVKDLTELSTLLSSEGIGAIQRITDAAKEGSFTKMLGQLAQKATSAKIGKFSMDKAADIYMAEDAAMKLAYFMTLRQKGLSRQGALLEVGRRMPMYNSVGEVWGGLRRSVQPWITFPVEAARILKNNMMDYPFKTSMLMQFPHFSQLGSYGGMQAMGRGQTYQTINDRKQQLPEWAQRPSTIMTPWVDVNGDFRHATLDFLPYTSVFPSSISKDAPFAQKLPVFQEIMPILSGIYHAASGKDAWGREIPANSVTQKASYAAIQTAGFLAPPILDKYMLNATDPTAFYRFHQDLGRYPNRYTGKEGDPFFDMFMNSVVGLKSYASSSEQAVANQTFKNKDLDSYKAKMSKEASALLKIGDTEGAGSRLEDVYQILLEQYGEPVTARRKFNDFIKRFTKRNKFARVFQGLSMEQIERELDLKGESMAFESGMVREEYLNTLKQARAERGNSSGDGNFNPLVPDMPDSEGFGVDVSGF